MKRLDVERASPLEPALSIFAADQSAQTEANGTVNVGGIQCCPLACSPSCSFRCPVASDPILCDACGRAVDEDARWRHRDCPPPALPLAALDAIERAHEMTGGHR